MSCNSVGRDSIEKGSERVASDATGNTTKLVGMTVVDDWVVKFGKPVELQKEGGGSIQRLTCKGESARSFSVESCHVDPFVKTSLNGAQGEVTGTDDMDNIDLQNLSRARREAANSVYQKPVNLPKNMAGKRVKDKKQKPINLPVQIEQPQEKIVVEKDPVEYITVPYDVIINNCSYSLYPDFSSKGTLRNFVPSVDTIRVEAGFQVEHVTVENYGFYTVDSSKKKGKTLIAAMPFVLQRSTAFKIESRHTDFREGLVYLPLASKLWQEFRASRAAGPIESSYTLAVKNLVALTKSQCEPALPESVKDWFSQVCDFTEVMYKLKVLHSYSVTNTANNMYLPQVIAKYVNSKIRTGVVNSVNTEDVPLAMLEKPYQIKPNIAYESVLYTTPILVREEFWFNVKPYPLTEPVNKEDRFSPGRSTQQWAVLTSTVRYSNSANNMYGALSRIIKARDEEEVYQFNQANLCTAFRNHYREFSHLFKQLKVKFAGTDMVRDSDTKYAVSNYPYIEEPLLDFDDMETQWDGSSIRKVDKEIVCKAEAMAERYKYILTVSDYFIQQISPTISECVFDATHNILNNYTTQAYTWFQHLHIPLLWRQQFADEPHPKKLLRQRMVSGTIINGAGCLVNLASVNVKDEIAKNGGKMPRAFVSYGSGVLCAPGLPTTFKERVNGWHYFTIGSIELLVIIYAQPKTSELIKLFDALIRARSMLHNHMCVAIYSDDSCYSGIVNGVPFGYNVDISSCDSSNGPPIFFLVIAMMSKIDHQLASLLLEQCCKPLEVKHPSDKKYNFKLRLPTAFEGSGTVLTTCLNHMASVLIAVSVAERLNATKPRTPSKVEQCVIEGAKLVGHKVTVANIEVDGLLQPSRFQFLKISPMMCTHKVTKEKRMLPVRNIGSIIKSFGQLTQDMQANQIGLGNDVFNTMTFSERFDCFFGAVVQGYKNEPSTPILEALRTRFPSTTGKLKDDTQFIKTDIDFSEYIVDMESLEQRYGCVDYEQTIIDLIDLQVGDIMKNDPALVRMMEVDYEYVQPTFELNLGM